MSKVTDWKAGLGHAWESLAEGWRELSQRATGALTRFKPGSPEPRDQAVDEMPRMTSWGFLAADVFDDDDRIVVRLEAPGMRKDDFHIELHDDVLVVHGEKRFERESSRGNYRMVQCAYGSFRRAVQLPAGVKADRTKATYRDGVLRIELPKADGAKVRRIAVRTA
jgi:HSP20 family protein